LGHFVLGRFVLGRFVLGRFVLGRFVLGRFVLGHFVGAPMSYHTIFSQTQMSVGASSSYSLFSFKKNAPVFIKILPDSIQFNKKIIYIVPSLSSFTLPYSISFASFMFVI
jgi:hypothetical protein